MIRRAMFLLFLLSATAAAHHSMSAAYDIRKVVSGTGTFTGMKWVNPHIHLFVEIVNEDGIAESWDFEGSAPSQVENTPVNQAVAEASLGKGITVDWSPSRDGSNTGLIRGIQLESGESMFMCPERC